jgi:hypothetical protein
MPRSCAGASRGRHQLRRRRSRKKWLPHQSRKEEGTRKPWHGKTRGTCWSMIGGISGRNDRFASGECSPPKKGETGIATMNQYKHPVDTLDTA